MCTISFGWCTAGFRFCTAGVVYLFSICTNGHIYIYIIYICVCVCVYVSMCFIYILYIYIYIYVLVCLTYASIYLYSTWRSYLALQQEPVSRCLLVRDASVILQNPQSAISSDGEEHVFMPQNPWKCVATILRNLGIDSEGYHDLSLMGKSSMGSWKVSCTNTGSLVFWNPQMETAGWLIPRTMA